jgi:hypothetical protein
MGAVFGHHVFKNRVHRAEETTPENATTAASLGQIPFNYLPHESPLDHGWALQKKDATGPIAPTFSSLPAGAPISVGLSIRPHGWYGMDYQITEAQRTRSNRLIFAASFGTDGKVYVFLQMPSRVVGRVFEERWIQLGVNIGPTRLEGNEGMVELIGKGATGWMGIIRRVPGRRRSPHVRKGELFLRRTGQTGEDSFSRFSLYFGD